VSSLPKPRAQSTNSASRCCAQNGGPPRLAPRRQQFRGVRKAVGDDVMIGIDPNTGWTLADALAAIDTIKPLGLGYIEQPIERRDLAGMAEIPPCGNGVPVMADEGVFTLQDAHALAQARACDAYCIKLYKWAASQCEENRGGRRIREHSHQLRRARGAVAARRRRQRAFLRGDPARAHDGRGRIHVRPERDGQRPLCPRATSKSKTGTSKCRAATASASRSTKHCSKKIRCRRKRSAVRHCRKPSPQKSKRMARWGKVVKDAGAKAN